MISQITPKGTATGFLVIKTQHTVEVAFQKTSSEPSINTTGSLYSLAGATYEIHRAEDDTLVGTITTDAEGKATLTLDAGGSYYAIETVPPKGFVLNPDRIAFTAGAGTTIELPDKPGTIALTIVKRDAATEGAAQPGTSLEGAEYRVTDVQVLNSETGEYEPLELDKSYNLAGYNYTLRDLGDGFAMFDGAVNVLDYVMEDYMVLANYVQSFPGGVVTGYAEPAGRITIVEEAAGTPAEPVEEPDEPAVDPEPSEPAEPAESTTYVVVAGDSLWKIAQKHLGSGARWGEIYAANRDIVSDPSLIYIGQVLDIPAQ